MLELKTEIRKDLGKKVRTLRKKGIIPAVLYGPKIEPLSLEVNLMAFEKTYKAAGESSLISLAVGTKKFMVLIHALETDAVSQKPIHIDFYQPRLDEEITATIPLAFEGESQACKDLGGTLVKNIHEVQVKALPQNLPHDIKVNIEKLKTFEDVICIKDLILPEGVKVVREQEEIIASAVLPEKIEEELAKPVEEKVEDVEKVGEKEKEEKKAEMEDSAKEKPASKSQEKTK